MRGGTRTRHVEEEESAFISMTDMTVSFLFIMMILLAFFATQIAPSEMVPREEYEKVSKSLRERDEQVSSLLKQLEVYRLKGDQSVPWLMSENKRLTSELQSKQRELDGIRKAIGVVPGGDIIKEAALLRDEIERLHRLLDAARENNPIERYNSRVADLRGRLLQRIQTSIKASDPSIDVEISRTRDALEFKGDGLFPSKSDIPTITGKHKMEIIAKALRESIGCFALSQQQVPEASCNKELAVIDALQVEGHTDSTGPDSLNMDLSSRRGVSVYSIFSTAAPDMLDLKNLRGQPILSVAGYGKGRPIMSNDTKQGRDANRRIDIRFIMFAPTDEQYIPKKLDDLSRLQRLLTQGP